MLLTESKRETKQISWLGWIVLLGIASWVTLDLLRTLVYSVTTWGFISALTDGVVIFRLGEALILLPLAVFFLKGRDAGFFRQARWVIWAGALLAGISFLGLNGRIAWAPLVFLVALGGLVAPWLARPRRGCLLRLMPYLGLTGLLFLHLLVNLAGFLLHGYALVPYPAPYPGRAAADAERRQQDVRYLGSELARLHMNAFHTLPARDYWAEIARLEAAAPGISDQDLALEMMRFVASVGDAHTSYRISPRSAFHVLPVDLQWYGDALHVRGISEAYPQALGARILAIGSLPVESVYQAALPYISHENDSWARVQSSQYLNLVELLVKVGAAPAVGLVTFILENASHEKFEVEIAPLGPEEKVNYLSAAQEVPFYLSQPDQAFWYEYGESSQTLYFRYAACIDPLGFRRAAREFWELYEKQPVKRVVIDLRDNGGGNTYQFDYFFMPELKKHPELDDPQRLFVLIDRVTFSSASDHAAHLAVGTRATLVGEPTGGKPNGYGEVRGFRLPNSRARINYSTNYFQTMDIDPLSIEPDVLLYTPAEAVFAGEDAVLDFVAPEESW